MLVMPLDGCTGGFKRIRYDVASKVTICKKDVVQAAAS
jgi:hypothetical protein